MFLFIYGNLLNMDIITQNKLNERKISSAITVNSYFMTSLTCKSYPIISNTPIKDNQIQSIIKGEIYEVNESILKDLDLFFSNPYFYTRELIDVVLDSNEEFELTTKAYCYLIKNKDIIEDIKKFFTYTSESIDNGDWYNYIKMNS
jgi:gamma-glutamylcyclotransferase (GGCT)/AIG2-like uncharacterized protein YtfP